MWSEDSARWLAVGQAGDIDLSYTGYPEVIWVGGLPAQGLVILHGQGITVRGTSATQIRGRSVSMLSKFI